MKDQKDNQFLFDKQNYILMFLGVVLIILGFILMAGPVNNDPSVFDPNQVYSARRVTIAPILIILGFAIEFFAIFKK